MGEYNETPPPPSKFWFWLGRVYFNGLFKGSPRAIKQGGELLAVPEDYAAKFTKQSFTKALRPTPLPTNIGPYDKLL